VLTMQRGYPNSDSSGAQYETQTIEEVAR
jgi:hypothetical protein